MKKITSVMKNSIFNGIWFCGFNLFYFLFALTIGCCMFADAGKGISLLFISVVVLNLLIPIISVILYVNNKVYLNPKRIFRLFFALEMPLISLCVLRMFLLREITPFFALILLSLLIAIVVQVVEFLNLKRFKKAVPMVLGYELTTIISSYAFILSMFFVLPLLVSLLKGFLTFEWAHTIFNFLRDSIIYFNFWETILSFIFILFLFFLFSLFVLLLITPFVSFWFYIRSFLKYTKRIKNKTIIVKFAAAYIVLMALLSLQPDVSKELDTIQNYKQADSYEQKIDIAKKDIIKHQKYYQTFLTNKYIARYRYFGDKKNDCLKEIYQSDSVRSYLQTLFNKLATPFLYNGEFNPALANNDYQELFGENIQTAQKLRIRNAVRSTLFANDIAATVLDRDAKNVLLSNRNIEITLDSNLPIARVKVFEDYYNKTDLPKEVYYEFSLPQGSVVTDLKLGTSLEYQGEISTKGAARNTYELQMKWRQDPALLEKAGVRQYTLRVFPVERKSKQRVCYEYLTLVHNNKVELPNIYEKRNVYENVFTKHSISVNNVVTPISEGNFVDVPPVAITTPVSVKLGNEIYSLDKIHETSVLENTKIALLLDTSYNNKINWQNYLSENKTYQDLLKKNTLNIFFFNDLVSKPVDINTFEQVNIGKGNRLYVINSLEDNYDLILMLTSDSASDYSQRKLLKTKTPVYIIHTSDKIPPYTNELTNRIIKSNGDIETSLDNAVVDFINKKSPKVLSVDGEYVIRRADKISGQMVQNEYLKKIVYSKIVDNKIKNEDITRLDVLDNLHKIAKKEGIVTNYSSYIALVNTLQKDVLKYNENSDDRYNANLKSGTDIIVNQFDDNSMNDVKAVPEPEEWAMIIFGLILLTIFLFLKRRSLCKNI